MSIQDQLKNIKNLFASYQEHSENKTIGYCYMTNASGIYLKSVIEALQDIELRSKLNGENKADKLLMDIISQNIFPSN